MASQKDAFLQALGLPPDLTDEACTRSVSVLISLAVEDQSHSVSLKDIHDAVSRYECAEYLEPLDVLPLLLSCHHDGAMDLIQICALNNSPKELMIIVHEAIERVQIHLDREEEAQDDRGLAQTVIGVTLLCFTALPRSTFGKRTALELCAPVFRDLISLVSSVSPLCTREEGRALITQMGRLVRSLSVWSSAVADTNELQEIKTLLRELLDTTVVSCAPSIQAFLAVRAAETCFPRFFVKSSAKEGWQDGAGAMLEVQGALESLGVSLQVTYQKARSFSDLVYLAHATPPVSLSFTVPRDLHTLLINALQMNMAIDEALFMLLRFLTHDTTSIPPESATLLCAVLTVIASTHLDPDIRQLNLRLLSLTLTKLPPPPRIEMLLQLSTDEEFPQIRGPAVGLLKEAVLEALALPRDESDRNPFASAELLRIFGHVLFRPNPPDFFSQTQTREELAQSLELLRITDCLSFYYVLLQRDRENKTGVRCKGNVASVQSSLLRPLRRFLADQIAEREEHPLMAVLALQVGLDRIDGALHMLDLDKDS